jgi:hypothetical protein
MELQTAIERVIQMVIETVRMRVLVLGSMLDLNLVNLKDFQMGYYLVYYLVY